MSDRLAGDVAVVTGGGARTDRVFGIGETTAVRLAEEGATVVVADVDRAMAERTVEHIEREGGTAVAVETDVADEASVESMAAEVDREFGTVDVLVNNVGIRVDSGPITEATDADWNRILDVNLKGVGHACKHLVPLMTDDGGAIVNVSSANAEFGRTEWALYDSTKAGVIALTRDVACDHAADGVRANAILPGPTLTDYHLEHFDPDDVESFVAERTSRHDGGPGGVQKRWAHPDELADAILFLASDAASFVTGTAVNVDGGLTAAGSDP